MGFGRVQVLIWVSAGFESRHVGLRPSLRCTVSLAAFPSFRQPLGCLACGPITATLSAFGFPLCLSARSRCFFCVHVSVQVSPLHKDTSPAGLGPDSGATSSELSPSTRTLFLGLGLNPTPDGESFLNVCATFDPFLSPRWYGLPSHPCLRSSSGIYTGPGPVALLPSLAGGKITSSPAQGALQRKCCSQDLNNSHAFAVMSSTISYTDIFSSSSLPPIIILCIFKYMVSPGNKPRTSDSKKSVFPTAP